jgi:gamma-glutamyltranspeptidase/glutathione hydrolase
VTEVCGKRHDPSTVQAAVAAGHPATVAAGIEVLEEGGSAADAAVAACLASCVAETVMTGLLGGGHAIYFDAASGRARNLDCFVAAPGLGAAAWSVEPVELEIPFGTELVHYTIGIATCGVPGIPAGLAALHAEHCRLPWPRLVEPALRLARNGVEFPPAHAACLAMLAPVMTMNEGARIYAPGGELLPAGARLDQPGLVRGLELLAAEGPRSVYEGTIGRSLLALMRERGGVVTDTDLRTYEAVWSEPVVVPYVGTRFATRSGLSGVPDTLSRLPRLHVLAAGERAVALAGALDEQARGDGHTTNVSAVDAEGSACVLTTSLGLGSGDFLPGLDLHLNSMLGETDLLADPLEPGQRMNSMMAPSVALDESGVVLAAGAAGGTRLRSALLQVVAGVLDEELEAQEAVARPRLHPVAGLVHLEPGFEPEAVEALEHAGYKLRAWTEPHHYFGGVSVVGRAGSAGDPRRSGTAAAPRQS